MKAAILGKDAIVVELRAKPAVSEPTHAVVRVVLACVCGSDLWFYRGISDLPHGGVGHEFMGVVDAVGSQVTGVHTCGTGCSPTIRCATIPTPAACRPSACNDVRPGTATLALGGRADIKVVSAQPRHSTVTIAADTYAAVLPELSRAVAEATVASVPRQARFGG